MANKKNTKRTTKNTNKKKNTKKSQNAAKIQMLNTTVVLVLSFGVNLFLFLSNLGFCGFLGNKISSFLFGIFGYVQYIMPILLFVVILFKLANPENKRLNIKLTFGSILLVDLCSIIQLTSGVYNSVLDYYTISANNKNGGGILGGIFSHLLNKYTGLTGAYIILITILIVSIIFILEKNFIKDFIANKKEHKAVNDIEYFDDDIIEDNIPFTNSQANLYYIKDDENALNNQQDRLEEKPKRKSKKMVAKEPKVTKTKAKTENTPKKETDNTLKLSSKIVNSDFKLPPLSLLQKGKSVSNQQSSILAKQNALKLQETLASFGVGAQITNITQGPSVIRYEIQPDVGVRAKRISDLADDIKLSLAVKDVRIEAPIPGKSAVGIEVPNGNASSVYLRDLLESNEFQSAKSKITFAVGRDISGNVCIQDINKLPHLLVGGATGSGKSVFINSLIMSILYKASPNEVKFFMIDPKMIELNTYSGIPHLYAEVVTDPKKAAGVLKYAVNEMTQRYQLFSKQGVRNLEGYNKKVFQHYKVKNLKEYIDKTANLSDEEKEIEFKPQIVIVVDEFADLMMVAKNDVEGAVCRLAQLARAAGIHLILATQRPSVDVITGLIKANMPSRCALAVSSGIDSRTIIDGVGAEKLLGNGDMLFAPQGSLNPVRIQGAYVSESEVEAVVNFIKKEYGEFQEDEEVKKGIDENTNSKGIANLSGDDDMDEYLQDAGYFIIENNKASIGSLQRKFKIGFNRAARIMDNLAELGVVGEEEGTKPRQILMNKEQFENLLNSQ